MGRLAGERGPSIVPRTTGRGRWAEAYVRWATHEKARLAARHGHPGPAEPGLGRGAAGPAAGHGNSVPRFHLTWGHRAGADRALRRARAGRAPPRGGARGVRVSAIASTSSSWRGGAGHGPCGGVGARPHREHSAARTAPARSPASSRRGARAPCCSAPAAIGHNFDMVRRKLAAAASAPRPKRPHQRRAPSMSTGACSPSPRGAGARPDRPRPQCGTTSRGSANWKPPSGASTASGSSPGPSSLCGSTRPGGGLPAAALPGLRHGWRRSRTSARPATSTRGTC